MKVNTTFHVTLKTRSWGASRIQMLSLLCSIELSIPYLMSLKQSMCDHDVLLKLVYVLFIEQWTQTYVFRQDIKKICLLIAFQQSLSSVQKTANFRCCWQILVKNCCRFFAGDLKAFFIFFALIVFTLTLATIFVSTSFLPKVSKVKERGWKLNFGLFGNDKNWQGSAKLSPLLP